MCTLENARYRVLVAARTANKRTNERLDRDRRDGNGRRVQPTIIANYKDDYGLLFFLKRQQLAVHRGERARRCSFDSEYRGAVRGSAHAQHTFD